MFENIIRQHCSTALYGSIVRKQCTAALYDHPFTAAFGRKAELRNDVGEPGNGFASRRDQTHVLS
jgi:hypothetical protein